MSFTQDFRTQRRNYSDGETRIGEKDRLWYDSNTNSIRISDGVTPGGVIVGGSGGGSDYVLPTASALVKGGVKIGSNITITDGVISVAAPFSGSYTDLTNKPTLFDGAYASLSGKPTLFSGSYNDLTDKPTIPSLTGYATESFVTSQGYLTSVGTISYNDLSNKPTLFSGSYTDLSNKPTLFSGSYTDLTSKPTLFSGSYTDLSNKPTLFSGSYTDLTSKPTIYTSAYIGTTSLDFTRASGTQTLSGVSISGNAGTVTNGVYTTDTGTVTTTMLAGNIANAKLLNSTATIGSTIVALGATVSSLAGLNSVTANNFIGNASTVTNGVYTNSIGAVTDIMLAGSIANNKLANSSITVNGTSISLGNSATITAANPNALTIGTGLSGTSYTGSSAVTIAIDSTVATLTGSQTLTNKTLTLSGNLTFSDATIQSTAWLGSTDRVIKVAGSFAADQPFKSEVITDLTNGVSISTWMGLPAFATEKTWQFAYNGNMTFPDSTVQTTAYTATAAKGLFSVTTNSASGAGSLSYSNGVFTFTPTASITGNAGTATKLATARNINSVAFDGSADITVTAAAGTLTGTTLNSSVATSSLTSVGTLTSLSSGAITTTGTLALNASGGITTNQTTFPLVNTTATTINFAGAATTLNIGTSAGIVNISSAVKVGTGTFTKAGYATGDILLDNGGTDTPGLLMYYANNNNFAFDSWNGTFNILSGQLLRVVNNLNESGGAVKMAMDTTGNMVTTGFIQPGAWRPGQVIRDTMLNNSEFTVNATTVATTTSDTDFITYSYTPTSSSSYLIIHVHVADFRAASDTGGAGTDSYFSRIKVDNAEIVYSRQMTRSGESFRTGSLFPLTGRYTNSSTTAKTITVGVRRDSADDSITITNSATALTLRITEIAR